MSLQEDGSEQKQKGLSLLFHKMISRLLTLIAMNLLFLVCSIPIITLPNAHAALYRCAALTLKDDEFPLIKTFFSAFTSEFLKTMLTGWIVLLLLAGSMYGALIYWAVSSNFTIVFSVFSALLGLIFYAASCNLFYMLARVRLPVGSLLKNAFLLVFMRPAKGNIACFAAFAIQAVCIWYLPTSLPVIALIAYALSALIACFGVRENIETHVVPKNV